jgi:hypothetical protein
MKKIVFFLSAIWVSISAFGQNYIPIPADSTSEWRIWTTINDGFCLQHRELKYFFEGDTVIDSFTYQKLFRSGFYQEEVYGPPPWPSCDQYYTIQDDYVGGIRNTTGKVFFFDGFEDELIYDFTLEPGDTLNTSIAGSDIVVESIDSVLVGDEYRRRFNLNNPDGYSNWIIEGIGHQRGLIEPMYLPLEFYSEFLCYAETHVPIYPEDASCDLAVNIYENSLVNSLLSIYPNPSSGNITFSFNSNMGKNINFKIISSIGQIIVDSPWDVSQRLNEITFDLSSINTGIYVVVLQDGTNIIRKKFTLTK